MNVGDLKKYKDSLYTSLCRDITEFEKNFLYISGGILAFSITFIKDIIKLSEAIWFPLLFLSWLLIIISIAIMMYSFLRSAKASDELWKIVNDYQIEHSLYKDSDDLTQDQISGIKQKIDTAFFPIKESLKGQRWSAVCCFILGLLAFSTFVGANLITERNKHEAEKPAETKLLNKIQLTLTDSTILIKSK